MSHDGNDGNRETPPTVVAAIAAGVAPAPFLVTYSVLFILHGTVFPVDPPDITGSKGGEALAGVVAFAFLGVIVLGIGWFLSQRTRWLFLAGQATTLGVAIDLLLDPTSGKPAVPLVLAVTSAAAIVLGCVPASWQWAASPDSRPAPGATGPGQPDPARDGEMRGVPPWQHDAGRGYPAPSGWGSAERDGGPIDPNPGGGHGARAPGSA